jgi:hypothetical protein
MGNTNYADRQINMGVSDLINSKNGTHPTKQKLVLSI